MKTVCTTCDGDGIERCDNPDHGFIEAMPGEVGRLGCPCCGHDEKHRILGSKCLDCDGKGTREETPEEKDARLALKQSLGAGCHEQYT